MTIKILWDWDGTLADTYPVINAAYAYTFENLGLKDKTISFAEIKKITSTLQNKDTLGHIFGDKKEEARKYFYEYIANNHTDNLKPLGDALSALEFFAKKGYPQYLLSNKSNKKDEQTKQDTYLQKEVKRLGFDKFFIKVTGAGEFLEDKPHQIACLGAFDVMPSSQDVIYVIGDGEADLKVAEVLKSENIKAFSILLDSKQKYDGAITPDYKITDLMEITKIFL